METNNHQIVDYSAVLEAQYGALGTPERAKFDEEAYAFYTSQILLDARKNARLTQEELVGSEMCIRDSLQNVSVPTNHTSHALRKALQFRVLLLSIVS